MIPRRHVLAGGATLLGTSVLAGCLSGSDTNGEFEIDRIAFSSENPENVDSYEDVEDVRTFVIDESFWVLVATAYVPTDDDGKASLAYTFRTDTPDGSTWEPVHERTEEWEDVEQTDVLIIWERFSTFPEDPPGEYEMRIAVESQVEEKRLRSNEIFELEESG